MKKTVKPSPVTVIVCGVAAVLGVGAAIGELVSTGSSSAPSIALNAIVIGAFIFFLLKFLSQSKIYFDEKAFTVDGTNYRFGEITNVTVDSEQVLRNVSTLRITLYKGEDEICSFTKNDSGGKEFIAVMKKHGITVSIDV